MDLVGSCVSSGMLNENLGSVGEPDEPEVMSSTTDVGLAELGSGVTGDKVGVPDVGAIDGLEVGVNVGTSDTVGDGVGRDVAQGTLTQLFLPLHLGSHDSKSLYQSTSSQYSSFSSGSSSSVQKYRSTVPVGVADGSCEMVGCCRYLKSRKRLVRLQC